MLTQVAHSAVCVSEIHDVRDTHTYPKPVSEDVHLQYAVIVFLCAEMMQGASKDLYPVLSHDIWQWC